MADKKQDNRDIFDKALDYAVPAAGAVAGGVLGARLGGYRRSKFLKATKAEREAVDKAYDRNGNTIGTKEQEAAAVKALDESDAQYNRGRGGRFVGGAAGLHGGYETNEKYGRKGKR